MVCQQCSRRVIFLCFHIAQLFFLLHLVNYASFVPGSHIAQLFSFTTYSKLSVFLVLGICVLSEYFDTLRWAISDVGKYLWQGGFFAC